MRVVVYSNEITAKKYDRAEVVDEIGSLNGVSEIHHVFVNKNEALGLVRRDGNVVQYNLGGSTAEPALMWSACVRLQSYIRNNDIDVVYNLSLRLSPFVGISCTITRTPMIQRVGNDMSTIAANRGLVKRTIYNLLWRTGLSLADEVHANSKYMQEVALEFGASPSTTHVVYPNISVTAVDAMEFDADHTLGYVGRLHPRKGIDILLRSLPMILEEYPDTRLVLVGDDTVQGDENGYETELRRLADTLDIADNVEFAGWIPHDELFSYYRGFDLVICPSRHEGVNKVAVEALLSGTPVVASDIPTHRELVGNSFGRTVDRSPDAIAAGVVDLLDDDAARTKAGEKGSTAIRQLIDESQETWQSMFAAYR